MKPINKLALIGNPNVGKTTLFNSLTKSYQKTGNWPGVTVSKKTGYWQTDTEDKIEIIDLPGIYSFTTSTLDEVIARDYILNEEFDAVINIIDISALRRNLLLTLNLIEMGIPVILVLNKADLVYKKQHKYLVDFIQKQLNVPVILLEAHKKASVAQCHKELSQIIKSPLSISTLQVEFTEDIEKKVTEVSTLLTGLSKAKTRWLSVFILENYDPSSNLSFLQNELNQQKIETFCHDNQEEIKNTYVQTIKTRYSLIHSLFDPLFKKKDLFKKNSSFKLDTILMQPKYGIPIFLVVMYLVFIITQNLGNGLVDVFDTIGQVAFVDIPKHFLTRWHVPHFLVQLLTDGIGTGLHTAIGFIPLVFTLFILLSLLGESGYLSRAACVWHRALKRLGLPGKALMPMIVGFGCNIPAFTSMRTLDRKRDKLQMAFMLPLMSCSARLPTYAIFAAIFFTHSQGLIIFSLYLAGCLMAIMSGWLVRKTLLQQKDDSSFLMELPRYQIPNLTQTIKFAAIRTNSYILNAGKYIVIIVTILNLLNTYHVGNSTSPDSTLLAKTAQVVSPVLIPIGIPSSNWQATVALISGIFAKEVIIGTLNSLYVQHNAITSSVTGVFPWKEKAQEIKNVSKDYIAQLKTALIDPLGMRSLTSSSLTTVANASGADIGLYKQLRSYFTPWQAYSYLLFILLYFPCLAAFATLMKEIGIGIASISGIYVTLLAWSVSTLFYQLTVGHSLLFITLPFIVFASIVVFYRYLNKTDWLNKQLESTETYNKNIKNKPYKQC